MVIHIDRRKFIVMLGSTAAAWPRRAHAEQGIKTWRIGLIAHGPMKYFEPFFERLRELGYVEGQNITIERRYAEGKTERFQEFAAEMVRLNADVIITNTTP